MRTLLLTAAAALLFCATDVRAQGGTTAAPSTTKPVTTTKPAPTDDLTTQKRSMSASLKTTLASADNLLASANKMAEGANGERKDLILKVTEGIKTVKNDLTAQLGLVSKATDKTAPAVLSTAKEVNANSASTLERLKGELPSTKPVAPASDTKPATPVDPK